MDNNSNNNSQNDTNNHTNFIKDHMYENNSWSRFLDRSLPQLFDNTFKVDNFLKMADCSNNDELKELKDEQAKNIQLTKDFTDAFINIKKSQEVNGWSYVNTNKVREWKSILAFNYLINYHFMYKIKKRESYWSWHLIVISTICSTLTVLTISDNLIAEIIKYTITVLSVITSLIAAFMKKENFVERIKEMDRYIQKVGYIHVEIEGILQSKPWNRANYKDFYDKHYTDIVQLFSSPPPMSPEEFKSTIINITIYNPELVYEVEPWFELKKVGDIEYYHMTEYGKEVINSDIDNNNMNCICRILYSIFCCCAINIALKSKFMHHKAYNDSLLEEKIQEKKQYNKIRREIIEEDYQFDKFLKDRKDGLIKVNEDVSNKDITV